MFHLKYLFYFILLHLIIAAPQFNLHYTDWVSQNNSENNNALQHTCLRVVPDIYKSSGTYDIMSYCMSEWPLKFNIQNNNRSPKLTFAELSKQNKTSQDLYLWSTPIDIIERYQLYLNELSTSNDSSLAKEIFYNCTIPRFGPMCQYELPYYNPRYSSLNDIIEDFYMNAQSHLNDFTCYTHLKCNRGLHSICLDWTEICDGKFDCLDDGIDEKHCWQLEINQCKNDEYRCRNGQCIPQSFYRDNATIPECVDDSDKAIFAGDGREVCYRASEPSFRCEDITCADIYMTSSCNQKRTDLLMKMMYSNNNKSTSEDCWSAFQCLIKFVRPEYSTCDRLCKQNYCNKTVMTICPEVILFPYVPVLFGNIYFVYKKSDLQHRTNFSTIPFYICSTTSHYDAFFVNITKIFFNNMTCVNPKSLVSPKMFEVTTVKDLHMNIIYELYSLLNRYHLPFNYTSTMCNRSNMYQCLHSSKCISIYRLMDNISDCPYMDDENINSIYINNAIEQLNKTYFKCQASNKYIHQSLVENGDCNCGNNEPGWCEDEDPEVTYIKTKILFQHICDGFIDLSSTMIQKWNATDETECEQWKCNNIYTRCNRKWNCLNGADESGCTSHSTLNCSSKHHLCVSPNTNQFICLPVEKANDGNIDCLGAIDEPSLCASNISSNYHKKDHDFYCIHQNANSCISNNDLCDGFRNCDNGDDEQFCTLNRTTKPGCGLCSICGISRSDVEHYFCYHRIPVGDTSIIYFTLDSMIEPIKNPMKNIANTISSNSPIIQNFNQYERRCHRGLDLRVWLNTENKITYTCLCPPSYYGDRCQYQNQRISLAIGFRALSDSWRTLFAIVISLIDDSNQRIIHSYEQFTYLSIRDCPRKFNIYLLYSTRPKDSRKYYAIHIDIYDKILLKYRGSVLLPITFPFLPVHRLAFIADIPRSDDDNNVQSCLSDQCIHGQCIKYLKNPQNLTFCQCDEGWSGKYCTIQHTCICASDSLCIGVSANNRSICVCPLNRLGPRCLLNYTICETNNNSTCQNGGQCISYDDYLISYQKFVCICPKGYSGVRCEIADTKLILSFDEDIVLSQSISIHFIEVFNMFQAAPKRATTFQTVSLRQDSVTIYWSRPFHLVFTELSNKTYYLTVIQKTYNPSTRIDKMIKLSDRCPNITELFNQTFLQWPLIRRIKYYHLPCQNSSFNLSCFHDEVHLCICYDFQQQRLANCFEFDHNMAFDCFGQSECENDAQCLQDSPDCPKKSICICPSCFYGKRCQFSTNGFGLSLDAILGYHILPYPNFTQQPFIIKISLALTIIFITIGFVNGIVCLITFKNKTVCEVGCGLYLFGSSITTLFAMSMFGLKFLILILAQMTIISNRTFLQIQCHSIDFLLRTSLCMDQWLNACVAMERVFTMIKATRFDKKKSKKIAKFVIIIVLIIIIGTSIHDPIYRHLIDEENDVDDLKRTWCVVRYPSSIEVYNYLMHSFHFFGPFLINLISSIVLITKKSRQQATIQTQRTYQEILREQFRQHKHLLTAPIILVILALPRLIITFISKCMKSTNDTWLFLIAYFISFIPPMLTFVIFIVPSKFYTKEFRRSLKQYRSTIQRRLNLIP